MGQVDLSQSVLDWIGTHRPHWASQTFLSEISTQCLHELLTAAELVTFQPGNVLTVEGEFDTDVFLLLTPSAKVSVRDTAGSPRCLALRTTGDVIGDMAAVDGSPRSATVHASGLNALFTARLTGPTFLEVVSADATAHRILHATATNRLRAANRRRVHISGTPAARIATLLAELLPTHGTPTGGRGHGVALGVNLTRAELGELVGISQATAERGMRELRESGLVETNGRRLIVLDAQGLQRYTGTSPGPSNDGEVGPYEPRTAS